MITVWHHEASRVMTMIPRDGLYETIMSVRVVKKILSYPLPTVLTQNVGPDLDPNSLIL